MKRKICLLMSMLCLAPAVYAVEGGPSVAADPKKDFSKEPFDESQKQAFQISYRSGADEEYVIGNVRWGELPGGEQYVWQNTSIKPLLLDEVYYGFETGGVGHVFMVYTFKKGGITSASGETTDALVVSAEARMRKGQKYSWQEGIGDNYPLIWNLSTWQSFVRMEAEKAGRPLSMHPMKVLRGEKIAMLVYSLQTAVKDRSSELYNTLTNNCSTNQVDVINAAVAKKEEVRHYILPNRAQKSLLKKGLIGEGIMVTSVKDSKLPSAPKSR